MPISTRTIERWTCDRCGTKAEFPDEQGRLAFEAGWLQFDLGRSLESTSLPVREENEQILCPADVNALRSWFSSGVPGQEVNRKV